MLKSPFTKPRPHLLLPLVAFAVWLTAAPAADAQFGVGLHRQWEQFRDPYGRFTIGLPPGWSYEPALSSDSLLVFVGSGAYDYFYVEIVPAAGADAQAWARDMISHYQAGQLPEFALLNGPSAGELSGLDATFIVYSFLESPGVRVMEGRAFAVAGTELYSIAFAHQAAAFDRQVALFNAIMGSLRIGAAVSAPTTAAAGLAVGRPAAGAAGIGVTSPTGAATAGTAAGTYISPGGFFRFTPPAGWMLWEEQSTALGDFIEPWHDLFNWPGRPMTKVLFVWDYFDEWLQTGDQYDVVMAVVENVPGTQADAAEALKNAVTGDSSFLYTTSQERMRLGPHAALAVKIVVRPGYTEPWSLGEPWHRNVTFFVFKQGTTLFVWAVPDELRDAPQLAAAIESFQWLGR